MPFGARLLRQATDADPALRHYCDVADRPASDFEIATNWSWSVRHNERVLETVYSIELRRLE
jgi:hypothetical protein